MRWLNWLFGKSWKKPDFVFPQTWLKVLQEKVYYYNALSEQDQAHFKYRIQEFLLNHKVTGRSVDVTVQDRILVAASAVIPVFKFPNWRYTNLSEVILVPDKFNHELEHTGDHVDRHIIGMVGNGPMDGLMVLSKPALHHGFKNESDKHNVAIHEFVHLIDKMDGRIDGLPKVMMDRDHLLPWIELVQHKMSEINLNKSDINPYGGTSDIEFFAVSCEYFFERPKLMAKKHPEVYRFLEEFFNQTMREMDLKKTVKVRVGRNSPCPCGSGLKYKKCCLE